MSTTGSDLRKCRYCSAMIKWGVAASSGKPVPLDSKPVRVWVSTNPGRTDPSEPRLEVRTGWIAHFATCSGADQARADVEKKRALEVEKRRRG